MAQRRSIDNPDTEPPKPERGHNPGEVEIRVPYSKPAIHPSSERPQNQTAGRLSLASLISTKPSVPARTSNGDCEGRKPYGVMPGEQETIAKMRQMPQEGLSHDAIAKAPNDAGIAPRTTSQAGKQTKGTGQRSKRILDRTSTAPGK